MHLANERAGAAATAPTLDISPTAMEVTMVTNTLSRPSRATLERYATIPLAGGRVARPDVLVWLEVASRPWGRLETTPHQLWNAFLDGSPLVMRHRDPEHESCRELLARGVTGTVAFIHKSTGQPGMVMDIEQAAKLSTTETDTAGLRTAKYVPFNRDRVVNSGAEASSGTTPAQGSDDGANTPVAHDVTAAIDTLKAAAGLVDGMSSEERALLDGVTP